MKSFISSVVVATILSVLVVNPTIKFIFFPLAIQQDRQEAFEQCDKTSDSGYDCLSI